MDMYKYKHVYLDSFQVNTIRKTEFFLYISAVHRESFGKLTNFYLKKYVLSLPFE